MTAPIVTVNRSTDDTLSVETAMDNLRAFVRDPEKRAGLLAAIVDEPRIIGCAGGRFLHIFAQDDALRADKYDAHSKRVARYRL